MIARGSNGESMSKDECILARIDVVAFTKLSKTDLETDVFDVIREITQDLNEEIRRSIISRKNKEESNLECARYYGDTIDIYFRTGDLDALILILLEVIVKAQRMALNKGFLVKGAIVKGDLHETKDGFTGPAMVTASELEKECPYSCVTIAKDVMEILDDVAIKQFRTKSDFSDFRKKMITCDLATNKHYLNYLEACPISSPDYVPELKINKESLVKTIERYVRILSHDPNKCEEHLTMYEHALETTIECVIYTMSRKKESYL